MFFYYFFGLLLKYLEFTAASCKKSKYATRKTVR